MLALVCFKLNDHFDEFTHQESGGMMSLATPQRCSGTPQPAYFSMSSDCYLPLHDRRQHVSCFLGRPTDNIQIDKQAGCVKRPLEHHNLINKTRPSPAIVLEPFHFNMLDCVSHCIHYYPGSVNIFSELCETTLILESILLKDHAVKDKNTAWHTSCVELRSDFKLRIWWTSPSRIYLRNIYHGLLQVLCSRSLKYKCRSMKNNIFILSNH